MEKAILPIKRISNLMNGDAVKAKFAEMLGAKAPQFISSVMSAVNSNALLQNAVPQTVYGAALMAATLDLPVNSSIGFAYIVPYKVSKPDGRGNWIKVCEAQFQIGYKGFVQLAIRSGQYLKINVIDIKEGQMKIINPITEEYAFGEPTSETVVGYLAYFKLVTGFEKYMYMSIADIKAHADKYSQTAKTGKGMWAENFDAMARKTVLKRLLSKYGVLSVEMQKAQIFDQGMVMKKEDDIQDIKEEDIEYIDNDAESLTAEQKEEAIRKGSENAGKVLDAMKKVGRERTEGEPSGTEENN